MRTTSLATVKSHTACVGGYAGLYDLVGNAAEWTDSTFSSHDAGADADAGGHETDETKVSGGSFASPVSPSCSALTSAMRSRQAGDIGFRCCVP